MKRISGKLQSLRYRLNYSPGEMDFYMMLWALVIWNLVLTGFDIWFIVNMLTR